MKRTLDQQIELGESLERIDRATARRKFIWLAEAVGILALGTFLVFTL